MVSTKSYYVYILASTFNGTLYIGVTNDLIRRVSEHISGAIKGFTKKYKVTRLVYYEEFWDINAAIARETQLKNWHRDWKKNLIERDNPHWDDLYLGLIAPSLEPYQPIAEERWMPKQVRHDKQ